MERFKQGKNISLGHGDFQNMNYKFNIELAKINKNRSKNKSVSFDEDL